jgi:hypothetical protein
MEDQLVRSRWSRHLVSHVSYAYQGQQSKWVYQGLAELVRLPAENGDPTSLVHKATSLDS